MGKPRGILIEADADLRALERAATSGGDSALERLEVAYDRAGEQKQRFFTRLRRVAAKMSIPGWTFKAKMFHERPRIQASRRDGAGFYVQKNMNYHTEKSGEKKLMVGGEWLKDKGHILGSHYDTKLPGINSTMKYSVAPAKYAKRLSNAIAKKFLPSYLTIWNEGLALKKGRDTAASAQANLRDTLLKEFPSLFTTTGYNEEHLGLKLRSGRGSVRMYGDGEVDIELHSLPAAVAKKVFRALK